MINKLNNTNLQVGLAPRRELFAACDRDDDAIILKNDTRAGIKYKLDIVVQIAHSRVIWSVLAKPPAPQVMRMWTAYVKTHVNLEEHSGGEDERRTVVTQEVPDNLPETFLVAMARVVGHNPIAINSIIPAALEGAGTAADGEGQLRDAFPVHDLNRGVFVVAEVRHDQHHACLDLLCL